MKKKKQVVTSIDVLDLDLDFNLIAKKLNKIFDTAKEQNKIINSNMDQYPSYDGEIPESKIPDVEKLDDWCEKMLKQNNKVKFIKNKKYLYQSYTNVDRLLKKYGGEIINHLSSICPIKHVKKSDLYDSLAYTMFTLKIDPYSILDIPPFKLMWDKISDNGHD